jgi:hypothetical protein
MEKKAKESLSPLVFFFFFLGGWAHNPQAVRGGWAQRSQAPATICPIDLYGILCYIIAMSIDIERSCYHARNG